MSRRSSLKSVQRASYGSASEREGSVGDIDPGLQTERSEQADVGSFYLNRGRKVYELKNHLGNVLAVVSDVKLGVSTSSVVDYYIADVVEMTDYEPFGMELAQRHWVSSDRYRFGFQGQEGDDEWNGEGNMLAFKYRVHDSRLGRFLSIDPLTAQFPGNSSYAFSQNRLIDSYELEGQEKVSIHSPAISRALIAALKITDVQERYAAVKKIVLDMVAQDEFKDDYWHRYRGLKDRKLYSVDWNYHDGLLVVGNNGRLDSKGELTIQSTYEEIFYYKPSPPTKEPNLFDKWAAWDASLEGSSDPTNAGTISIDYAAINLGGCVSQSGKEWCGTFSIGWVKDKGFGLTFTSGIGAGNENGFSISLSGGEYVGDGEPNWGDILGASAQASAGYGKISVSISGNLNSTEKGGIQGVGDKYRVVSLSFSPTGKGPGASAQATYTWRILGAKD